MVSFTCLWLRASVVLLWYQSYRKSSLMCAVHFPRTTWAWFIITKDMHICNMGSFIWLFYVFIIVTGERENRVGESWCTLNYTVGGPKGTINSEPLQHFSSIHSLSYIKKWLGLMNRNITEPWNGLIMCVYLIHLMISSNEHQISISSCY